LFRLIAVLQVDVGGVRERRCVSQAAASSLQHSLRRSVEISI